MMQAHSSMEATAIAAAAPRRLAPLSANFGLRRTSNCTTAVTMSAVISSAILSWNAGFLSERAGSPTIMMTPVANRTIIGHQTNGKNRDKTAFAGWSAPNTRSRRRSIISAELATRAIAAMCTACTVGTTQLVTWIAWLSGVWSIHAQITFNDLLSVGVISGA